MGVGRDAEDGSVDGLEARQSVVVLDDLGRADEGEIKRVEEENDPGKTISRGSGISYMRTLLGENGEGRN